MVSFPILQTLVLGKDVKEPFIKVEYQPKITVRTLELLLENTHGIKTAANGKMMNVFQKHQVNLAINSVLLYVYLYFYIKSNLMLQKYSKKFW